MAAQVDVADYFDQVVENVSYKWEDLARKLGFGRGEIKSINATLALQDPDAKCREVLERWQGRNADGATLQVLKQALIDIGERLTAESLKLKGKRNGTKVFTQPKMPRVSPTPAVFQRTDSGPRGAERPVILMINDEYGTSKGGVSTINCEAVQTLKGKAAVYATVLQLKVPPKDKEAAERDEVKLITPVQPEGDTRKPSIDWLAFDYPIRYPKSTLPLHEYLEGLDPKSSLPPHVDVIIGHADITDTAARNIHNAYYKNNADLIMFTHVIPEDTEYYKGGRKAMKAGEKEKDMLDKVDNAKAAFSVGRRIFNHFSTKYKGGKTPQSHHVFLPKPSKIFLDANVSPGGGQKVVLSIGRVRKVEKLKGHDLVGESMRDVVKRINSRWLVIGISEDDWETSQKILEDALNSPDLNPTLRPYGTQDDIRNDMMMAHLVLMPSRSEPFGLVGLEAIAAGIPVLISDKTGLAKMITDLIKQKKISAEHRNVIVETSVNDRDRAGDAKRWADRIVDVLEYSDYEFEKAARFKRELVESRYWEESHNAFLQACGITTAAADQ
ncbi:PREDICTED: uncharacterized protein LOC109465254 isoform X2 [Branchiostoma belcheri]|uniref:Uncharacterized protein LOC109465254 isoform X2 n=1 Tax=Branchiostoma belcheri TaxID=7741 RepID=A0A6P4YGT5_BRABE|nr:PREDICTED: uncharacterized protein LOC109465254 isoform X2 [Branchiostoma belcheri]